MKNSPRVYIWLIGIPWAIILGMVITAYLPILTGNKYLLPVKPVDPRDVFRGNYVNLRYDFSVIDSELLEKGLDNGRRYGFGDQLYLDLTNKSGVLTPVGIYDSREKARNIALKVQPTTALLANEGTFYLVGGIESFFAPAKAAVDWENALRENKVFAEVAIDSSGRSRLTRLVLR